MDSRQLTGVVSLYDVAKAVVDSQNFENKLLKAYIRDWPESESSTPSETERAGVCCKKGFHQEAFFVRHSCLEGACSLLGRLGGLRDGLFLHPLRYFTARHRFGEVVALQDGAAFARSATGLVRGFPPLRRPRSSLDFGQY